MSKTEDNIAWRNQKLYIRWRRIRRQSEFAAHSELVAFGRGEDDAGSQTGAHLGTIRMHPPMGGVGRWRQVLGLDPVDKEVGQCLRLDGGAGMIVDGVGSQIDGPFGHSARSISASDDLGKWGCADHSDWMLLEVRFNFLAAKCTP